MGPAAGPDWANRTERITVSDHEKIDEFQRDGWNITVELAPDWEYEPGRFDDIYPRLEEWRGNETVECPKCEGAGDLPDRRYADGWRECTECEGSGEIENPVYLAGLSDVWTVTPAELDRVIKIGWGEDVSAAEYRKARAELIDNASAIVSEDLSWVGVIVTASRGHISGNNSLWGVDYDLRQRTADRYAENGECVRDHCMVENAIEAAARSVVGDLATLALSYD